MLFRFFSVSCLAALGVFAPSARSAAPADTPLPTATAFPAAGATNACPDTPLRLVFSEPPTLGTSGLIRILDAQTGQPADTIDLSDPAPTKTIGTEPGFRYYPVIIAGNIATIYPRNGSLQYGHRYAVTIDAGVFRLGIRPSAPLGPSGWTFRTRAEAPRADRSEIVVAADGTGDFCTVQGALDFVPAGNTRPTTIRILPGVYEEIVFFTDKHALTLRGDDRTRTIIEYATNDRFNPTRGNPFGPAKPDPSAAHPGGHIYHRGVLLAHRVDDLVVANLTIRNTTPPGGSQAEAIILNGTTHARATLKDVDLFSYQDTLQINGQAFVSGCRIDGDVDFLWGTGPCFFENCTFRSLRSGAYFTQIRNPATNHGYVFAHCVFTGAPGVRDNYLSRIGTDRFPHSEVVLLDCTLTEAVGAPGWQIQGAKGTTPDVATLHFWEFNSRDPAGHPVDTSKRLRGSRQLVEPADADLISRYRDPGYVLGGWNPAAK